MLSLPVLITNTLAQLNTLSHRTYALPSLVFYVTSRCNSRCISCAWWKTEGAADLSLEEIRSLAADLPAFRVRRVVFSGGEPLLRREVFEIAALFRDRGILLDLLTNGLLLERHAEQVAAHFASVTLSLDGHTPALYRQIRGIDGLEAIEHGVARLKRRAPGLPLRARSVIQRANYRHLPDLIDAARAMGLVQISFLAADVRGAAFAHGAEARSLLLEQEEVKEFERLVEQVIRSRQADFERRFVAESPDRLRRLPRYYAARLGLGADPPVACNAPWVSAVVEADGAVRPCFFQPVVGHLRRKPLRQLLREELPAFRTGLDVSINPLCVGCVCTLKAGIWR